MFLDGRISCFTLSRKEGIPDDKSLFSKIASGINPSYSSNELVFLNLSPLILGLDTLTSYPAFLISDDK